MNTRAAIIAGGFLGLGLSTAVSQEPDEAGVAFFREKVHPMFEEHCYRCHGGEDKLKGDFRLTSREGLVRGGDFGPGYDKTDPAASILLEMVSYAGEDYQMPPKKKLPDADLAILQEWVEMGAPYDPALEILGDATEVKQGFTVSEEDRNWWAYRPVVREGGHETIDGYIEAGLKQAELEPNPLATPETLVRRAYYDITGLPPTPEEVNDYVDASAQDAEGAWKALVERLLASPQFGEKWGRHWLDVVRYAESNGFERDNPKPEIWRYRDWVIDSINADKPYDQFVIEQLAGDEIENPTRESLTATGFYRLMQWDDEPADRKQHLYDVHADNVLMASEAFLATTVGCARCHDHKADPISQKDYYSFMAFFAGVTPYQTPGTIVAWADEKERAELEADRMKRIRSQESQIIEIESALEGYFANHQKNDAQPTARITTFVDDARRNPATWSYTTILPAPGWEAVGTKVKNWLKAPAGFGTNVPNAQAVTHWDSENIWMRTNFGSKSVPESLVLEIYYDEDVEVFLNGTEVFKAAGYVTDYQVIDLGQKGLDAFQTGNNVLAIHCQNAGGGQYIDASLRTGAADLESLSQRLKRGGKKLAAEIQKVTGKSLAEDWQKAKDRLLAIRREQLGTPINAVAEHGTRPPTMNVHLRGSAHALGDEVVAGFPAVLDRAAAQDDPIPANYAPKKTPAGESSGQRLALAQWIASEDNPLTARVMVNRIWQHYFSEGIVRSSSDFGKLGEKPSDAALLDFLASEFMDGGWSLKSIHRQILMSDTYRRSSEPKSPNLSEDPQNRLHWRNPMRRLTAEEIRDSILAMSGQLNLEPGGKWDYPPLPAEVLATASKPGTIWPISKDESLHTRRSLYIHIKRSLRHPMMVDFDQAQTDSPCAVRFATTVPTQSLAMLNSGFVNDQAVALADRLRAGSDASPEERVRSGLELVMQRSPQDYEIAEGLKLIQRMRTDHGLSEEEALNRFALLALNLNEFVYLD